ncbi:MAG: M4 family metallopeptidase, partial [Clostridia bacterium]|nr:M4 family metallopeptidase [Clostridia bacterium]
MKKNNSFKHLVLFTLFAIVFALASVFFVPAKNIASADDFSVVIENQVLTSVDGDFTGSKIENEEDVLEYLNNFKSDFGFDDAKDNLKFNKTVQSLIGNVFQFNQYVDGLKVYGGELNVGTNKNKRIKSIDGKYYINPAYDKNIAIVESEGLGIAKGAYQDAEIYYEEQVILPEGECVAYIFFVAKADESLRIFINASTGQIVKKVGVNSAARSSIYASGYNTSAETIEVSIDGNDVELPVTKYTSTNGGGYFYALADASGSKIYTTKGNKNNNANDMSTYTYTCYDSANNSTNPAADFTDEDSLKAYNSLLTCYNFYKDEDSFGISIDGIKNKNGQRIDLIAIVHFGSNYENAGYVEPAYNNYTHKYDTYGYFIFGDGKSGSTSSFVNGLDIVGHEYQHAMTSSIVALEYSKESGALSEAFSDIFGAVIEGKGISSPDFWKLGEDVVLSSSSGTKYLRNMANPSATGCVSDYSQVAYYTNRTSDYGGVHYVCTLPTYATYLMYKKAPEFFNEYNILRLWYQTLSHLTTTSGIDDFCAGMMRAADELEMSDAMKNVIEYAFATVGVPGYYGTKTWNNNGLTTFQGAGTIASPYLIKTVADLASLAYYVNSGEPAHAEYLTARYKLDADLDLGGVSWLAIGTATNPFNGYFNGASHTITGLNLEANSSVAFSGLFGYVGEGGFIYDLNIGSGSTTTEAEYVGAIAGRLYGGISGCSSQLAITGKNVGGLVGLMINKDGGQKVANCFVKADLVGEKVGGLVCTFATEKNQNDNLYESAYVTSSYYQGKITALNGGGILAEGNAIYLVNNLVYATFDGKNNQTLFGGLVANLSCNNPISLDDATNVYNYVLTNRIYANFTNTTQANCGLIAGFVYGSAAVGQALISGNIAKTVSGINFVYSIEDESSTKLEDNKLSNDVIFSGDFDFDNASYYENQDWTVLSQSASFDLVGTFKIVNKNMPSFKDMDFWLNVSGYSFAGGDGTKDNPYQIATAEQLASLSSLLLPQLKYSDFFGYYYDYENYNNYSSAYYILTDDIDLGGKVWSGLGYAIYSFENDEINRNSSYTKTYFFTGSFDGNGHVIKNMKSLGVYSIGGQSNDGHSYLLYEF